MLTGNVLFEPGDCELETYECFDNYNTDNFELIWQLTQSCVKHLIYRVNF